MHCVSYKDHLKRLTFRLNNYNYNLYYTYGGFTESNKYLAMGQLIKCKL